MNDIKKKIVDTIDGKSALFADVSKKIWSAAELSLKEFKSAEALSSAAEQLGFTVQRGVCGIETAFTATFGTGKPNIAILAEYDALSGLSQKAGVAYRCPVCGVPDTGHGCGHNMLGAGALAAAYAVKEYLKSSGKSGTVTLCGCPGEEGGAAKAFMARDNFWYGFDAAVTWHPGDEISVPVGTCNSCIQVLYRFKGTAAHAAGCPELGRSALDAVELMNVGVQYLREHVPTDARIHYAIIDGGGVSPNVVQPTASVLYMIRSIKVKNAKKLETRVDDIARGAALMTGTEYEKVFIDGMANTVPNDTLAKIAHDNLSQLSMPEYTAEEMQFAQALYDTIDHTDYVPGEASLVSDEIKEYALKMSDGGKRTINNFVMPLYTGNMFSPGSTDVGDVSWQTPAVQVYTCTFVAGSPGHSWQNVSAGGSSIGDKSMILAAKAMAMTAVDLYENPDLLAKARAEYAVKAADGYVCPIPDGEMPKIVPEK